MLSLIKEGLKCSGFAYEDRDKSQKSRESSKQFLSFYKRIFAFFFFLSRWPR